MAVPAMEDEAPNTPRRDVILIADASPEGQTIAAALRTRGFAVAFSPIERLEARVLDEMPRVLLVDIDQPGARDAIERLRELPAGQSAELVCLGSLERAGEVGATSASGRAFERPLDSHAILAHIAALAESAPLDDSVVDEGARVRETVPPAALEDGSGHYPAVLPSNYPSAFPGAGDALDLGSLFPEPADEGPSPPTLLPAHPTQLSPELVELLSEAEQRVVAELPASAPPAAAEDEGDLVLSDELLSILEDPIDPDDEAPGTGPELGHGGALEPGTGPHALSLSGATTAAHAVTDPGGVPSPALSRTGPGEPASLPSLRAESPRALTLPDMPSLRATDPVSLTPAPRTVPRSMSMDVRSSPEGPATAWEPPRFSRMHDELESVRAVEPPPSVRRPPPPVVDPSSMPTPVFSAPAAPRTPAVATMHQRAPQPPSTASGLLPRPSEPPPSVRLAPPVPPPPAPAPEAPRSAPRPAALGEGDAPRALARAIAGRSTGSLAFHEETGVRRVVLQDGDVVTAGSGLADETLLAFLSARGDLERDVAVRLSGKLPPSGRHAGAALIAHGYLEQDALWPVLRAHAEWIIGRALTLRAGTVDLESEPPGRLRAEPNVFGGATGAEVFVEVVRRVIEPVVALGRLGGPAARIDLGTRAALLAECALGPEEGTIVSRARGASVGEIVDQGEPEMASVLFALVCLEVLTVLSPARPAAQARAGGDDPLDEEAIRMRVRARLAIVEDGDYFAILGIPRTATSYEIRRAYLELRRAFEPTRILTAATADLASDVRVVIEVLDEAYEILKDANRRERYRRAIEAGPPA
jgi:hypothetical protein